VSIEPDGFAEKPWLDHGSVLMRKRSDVVTPEELETIVPSDAREIRALVHNIDQLHREDTELREGLRYFESKAHESETVIESQISDLSRVREEAVGMYRDLTMAQHRAADAHEQSIRSAKALLAAEETIAQSKSRVFALEEAVDQLQERVERGERVMTAMRASISWRVTAPLRAFKRRAKPTSR
jgi:predicted  nucleic acid-binding Zn-ribbon protein